MRLIMAQLQTSKKSGVVFETLTHLEQEAIESWVAKQRLAWRGAAGKGVACA